MLTPAPRVLIALESADTRMTLRLQLEQKHYGVEDVTTSEEALAKVTQAAEQQQPYRLALIGTRLADKAGLDVLQLIKRLTPETICLMIKTVGPEPVAAGAQAASPGSLCNSFSVEQLLHFIQGGSIG